MKFNLKLDESLFDNDIDLLLDSESPDVEGYDDDFSEYEFESHDTDNVLPGPSEGADTGVASELISLINDEWEAVEGYNNAIASLRSVINENPFYESAIKVLEEISSEENAHIGQLQEVLKQISPNAAEIEKGKVEAENQLGFVGGVLPVQSWSNNKISNASVENNEELCTLCDVDDDM